MSAMLGIAINKSPHARDAWCRYAGSAGTTMNESPMDCYYPVDDAHNDTHKFRFFAKAAANDV